MGLRCLHVEDAAGRIGLRGLQRRIVAIERGTVGADLLVLVAHIDEDMRVIERNGCPRAHEFLDADLDHAVSAVVLEVRNCVAGHVRLQMQVRL